MSKVIPTEGSSFEFGTATPDTALCVRSYQRQAGSKTERDRTTMCDTEIITGYGLINNGTYSLEFFLDPEDAAQILLSASNNTNAVLKFKHTLPNGFYRTADVIITEMSDTGAQDADHEASLSMRVNNLSAWTP